MKTTTPEPPRDPCEDPTPRDLEQTVDLVQRYQSGEQAALDELLARCQQRLLTMARQYLRGSSMRSHLESMDIVQESNMVLMRKLARLEIENSAALRAYLNRIVLNKVRQAHEHAHALRRDRDRQVPLEAPAADDSGASALPADERLEAPSEALWREEVRAVLARVIEDLPPPYREVLRRRHLEEQDWKRITREMERPSEGATYELDRRARKRLGESPEIRRLDEAG